MQFGQIHVAIVRQYILQFNIFLLVQIHVQILKNTLYNLDKYILQFGQIYLEIKTNIFYRKSLLLVRQWH